MSLQHPEPSGQLGGGQASRELDQPERVAARLGDDPVAYPIVQYGRHLRGEQRPCIAIPQTLDLELAEVPKLVARFARCEHDPDRLRMQATRHEGDRQRRLFVDPLGVIDDA